MQKPVVFLYTSNKLLEVEIKRQYHLQYHQKMKCLGTTLTNDVQILYTKN